MSFTHAPTPDHSPAREPEQPLLCSLVVATYGRADALAQLFASLTKQTDRDFEVIVVDQNVDDRVVPFIATARGDGLTVAHIREAQPGLARARNIGLKHVRGGVVAFPDDDCWYEPDTIAAVREVFASNVAIDGVVGRWIETETAGPRPRHRLSSEAWRNFRGGYAASITLFFRTEVVTSHCGFDERLGAGRWYGSSEETDLLLRLLARGVWLEHTPDARIHHPAEALPFFNAVALRRSRLYGRGIGALYVKHRLSAWVRLRGLTAPFVTALGAPHPFAAIVHAGTTVLGRIEGAVRWFVKEARRPSDIMPSQGGAAKVQS